MMLHCINTWMGAIEKGIIMTAHSTHVLRITSAITMLACIAAMSACGSSSNSTQDASATQSTVTSVSTQSQEDTNVQLADKLRESLHDDSNGSDPIEIMEPAPATTTYNRSETDFEPGTYRLMVQCAGEGNLSVKWKFDGDLSDTITCSPDIATQYYSAEIDKTIHGSDLEIKPSANTDAYMDYRLDYIAQ